MGDERPGDGSATSLYTLFELTYNLINFNARVRDLLEEFEDGTAVSRYGARDLRTSTPSVLFLIEPDFPFEEISPIALRTAFKSNYPKSPWLTADKVRALCEEFPAKSTFYVLDFLARQEKSNKFAEAYAYEILFEAFLSELRALPDAPFEWIETVVLAECDSFSR